MTAPTAAAERVPSLAELLAADPGAWLRRAGAWERLATTLAGHADDLGRGGAGALPTGWLGADADRARAAADARAADLRAGAGTARDGAGILGRHAGEVLAAQRRVVLAALAVHPLLEADLDTGTVRLSRAALQVPQLARVVAALVSGRLMTDVLRFTAEARGAVEDAARSDAAAATALRGLRAPQALWPPAGRPVAPGAPPPVGAGPAAVRTWWAGLPEDARDRLLRTRPDLVGGTDGVPVAVRDRANRARLEAERVRLAERAARSRAAGDGPGAARAAAALAGLEVLRRRLEAGDARLLDVAPGAGAGRVVLAVGDPERAAHVVTHVPGTGAGWASAPEDLRRVEATRAAASASAPGRRVAGVLWTGYDAPPDLLAAASATPARDAAPDLRRFQEGLRTGHAGPAHLTVVGHSYGSTVTGRAAGPGFAADDVVFVGSPGVGVRSAAELGVPADRVWATTARHDPISKVPGSEVFGTSRGLEPTGLVHGPNPAAPGFGARVFGSAPGTLFGSRDDPRTPTDESAPASAHSAYWDPGSPSLGTLGRIVAGTAP